MRTFNLNLYPPDGYMFEDVDGSFHRSTGWKALEAKVREYRSINGKPPGEPWNEIMAQLCAKLPDHCSETTQTRVEQLNVSFNQRVIEWFIKILASKREKKLVFSDPKEAFRRAQICARCPLQRNINTGCAACIETVEKSREALLSGRIKQTGELKFCSELAEDTQSAVNIVVPGVVNGKLPANCWRKAAE